MAVDQDQMERVHAELDRKTLEFGHAVQGVFGTQEDPGPSFEYTCGLWRKGWPEVVVVGLSLQAGHAILNSYVQECVQRGYGPRVGEVLTNLANLPLTVGSTGPLATLEYVVQAESQCQRMRGTWHGAVQLILCDRQGKFPLDPEYDHAYMDPLQPCLAPQGKWDYNAGEVSA